MRDSFTEHGVTDSLPSRAPADQGSGSMEQGSMDRGSECWSPSTPTSSNAPPEPATVDEPLIDSSAAAPTERNPVPTPPPSEPAPSLRPVEELQALCDTATPGPWTTQRWSLGLTICDEDGHCLIDSDDGAVPAFERQADAEFIAAARTALPSLLARLRAAEETLAAVGALAEETDAMPGLRRNFDGSISPGIVTTDKIRAALAEGASR